MGEIMLIRGIRGLDIKKFDQIVPIFIKAELDEWGQRDGVCRIFDSLGFPYQIIEIDKQTISHSETVALGIEQAGITGPIFLKDSDSYFSHRFEEGNYVCVNSLHDVNQTNAKTKSYITKNAYGDIREIAEKQVISDLFCCGGYSFDDAEQFVDTHIRVVKEQENPNDRIYISNIIEAMIDGGYEFKIEKVSNYEDWGTLEDWDRARRQYKTLFIDLDGVLVESSGEYIGKPWGSTDAIEDNVKYIRELFDTGKVQVIITTGRSSKCEEITKNQLKRLDIPYHRILFDLHHCERILINDFSDTNAFPTARAINTEKNGNRLRLYLHD